MEPIDGPSGGAAVPEDNVVTFPAERPRLSPAERPRLSQQEPTGNGKQLMERRALGRGETKMSAPLTTEELEAQRKQQWADIHPTSTAMKEFLDLPLRERGSNRPIEVTLELRRLVRSMVAYGIPEADIAMMLNMKLKSLQKRFGLDLALGLTEANIMVGETALHLASQGRSPLATFKWLEMRAGWKPPSDGTTSGNVNVIVKIGGVDAAL